jgi:hypothetical protein
VTKGVTKASVLSNHLRVEPSRIAGDRTVTSAMPNKALSPAWGKSVGGVDERAGVKAGERKLSALNFLHVSWRQKASRFSGRRHASRCVAGTKALVGSSLVSAASSAGIERAGDSGCPKACRGGE